MREDEMRLYQGDTRDVSPDGRSIIRRSMGYLPGDIHQMSPVFSVNVFDAQSRGLVLALGRYRELESSHAWESDGSALIRVGPVRLRVSVADGVWSMDRDGWQTHPLDGDIATAHALLDPQFPALRYGPAAGPAAQPSTRLGDRLMDAALVAVFCLATAGTVYLYMTGQTEMQKLFRFADEYTKPK